MPEASRPTPMDPAHAPDGRPLPLPHERDEATGQTAQAPDPVIEQARRDIESGQVDTDMHATPGLDAARREALVPTPKPDVSPVGREPQAVAPSADRQAAKRNRS